MAVLKLVNNTGEQNERNLCFVNSSLQLLYSIPDIKDFFGSKNYRENDTGKLPVADEMSRIFRTKGEFPVSAAELRRLIGQYHKRSDIYDGSQQDMEEFTRLLLECIEKELENCKESASEFIKKNLMVKK